MGSGAHGTETPPEPHPMTPLTEGALSPAGDGADAWPISTMIVWYDGPQLWLSSHEGEQFLCAQVLSEKGLRWVAAPVWAERWKQIQRDRVDLRDVFLQSPYVYDVLDVDDNALATRRAPDSLTEAELPSPGCFLHIQDPTPSGRALALQQGEQS